MMAEILSNHDGEFWCGLCGHKPGHLVAVGDMKACQACLADAAARLAYEIGRDVCGNCRAFVLSVDEAWGKCQRRPPQHAGHGEFRFPDVQSTTYACEDRLPRDRFRAGAAPEIGGAR